MLKKIKKSLVGELVHGFFFCVNIGFVGNKSLRRNISQFTYSLLLVCELNMPSLSICFPLYKIQKLLLMV